MIRRDPTPAWRSRSHGWLTTRPFRRRSASSVRSSARYTAGAAWCARAPLPTSSSRTCCSAPTAGRSPDRAGRPGGARYARYVNVELLWWEGCPSTERALAAVREALTDLGLEAVEVSTREIKDDGDAVQTGFIGSPTILIDGVDLVPAAADEQIGLSCRVYRRRDGRVSPIPDPDDLREALRGAAERAEVTR